MILKQATDDDCAVEECSQCIEQPIVFIEGANSREFFCVSCLNQLSRELEDMRKASQ